MNPESNSRNIRLLLVDDEAGFREAIARRLSRRGLDPMQAESGEECLTILDKSPVDVVVLDVKMPGINGIETLKIIRDRHRDTQVILLTGNAAVSDGIQGIRFGAFDYLTKPIEIDHLANKIQQAFDMILLEKEKEKEAEYRREIERKMIVADRLASLGTLSTGIAHEINNPLAIINESAGLMQMILNKPDLADIPRRDDLVMALEKIGKSVTRAKRITHQLLGYVKKCDPELVAADMGLLIEESLELLKKEISDKTVDVRLDQTGSDARFWSDPYQIRQVLINLLGNAVQAVSPGGKICVSMADRNGTLVVSFSDDGVGIPKENLKKIFDPFFSTKSPDEGTGLGLYVVHKILTGLGGDIDVASEVGKGSIFTVRLPKFPDRLRK